MQSVFRSKQIATDYSPLINLGHWLPSNFDGVTERKGRFLVFELKHGEDFGTGQRLMLEALAKVEQFDVIVVNCEWSPPNEFGARVFNPLNFQVMTPAGLGEPIETSTEDFKQRYFRWCMTPVAEKQYDFATESVKTVGGRNEWSALPLNPLTTSIKENDVTATSSLGTQSQPQHSDSENQSVRA